MTDLLGAIGWGLLTFGAITHVWHHQRLRSLLALHLDYERAPALALTALEVALAIGLPVAWLTGHLLVRWIALAGFVLALGFMVWIGRLLATGSDLPCACSFSDAPTTWWSFARSVCVGFVGFLVVFPAGADTSASTSLATLAVGWALAAAIFVIPEAVSWPAASKALLARVDAHSMENHKPDTHRAELA